MKTQNAAPVKAKQVDKAANQGGGGHRQCARRQMRHRELRGRQKKGDKAHKGRQTTPTKARRHMKGNGGDERQTQALQGEWFLNRYSR